uniref:BPI2 domain-containing protein n=1 Tax=Panagrellus redivivus TaxID=6233 RepID=A0A7E4UP51_PANRE
MDPLKLDIDVNLHHFDECLSYLVQTFICKQFLEITDRQKVDRNSFNPLGFEVALDRHYVMSRFGKGVILSSIDAITHNGAV